MSDKAGYFFAAYGIVWIAVLGYTIWIATRVRSLEERILRSGKT